MDSFFSSNGLSWISHLWWIKFIWNYHVTRGINVQLFLDRAIDSLPVSGRQRPSEPRQNVSWPWPKPSRKTVEDSGYIAYDLWRYEISDVVKPNVSDCFFPWHHCLEVYPSMWLVTMVASQSYKWLALSCGGIFFHVFFPHLPGEGC